MQQEHAQVSVPRRILGTLLNALSAGVVPRVGAPYIAIGRTEETAALRRDLDVVEDGGAAMRFLIGPYGSGKSFLLQLMRGVAQDRGFVTGGWQIFPRSERSAARKDKELPRIGNLLRILPPSPLLWVALCLG